MPAGGVMKTMLCAVFTLLLGAAAPVASGPAVLHLGFDEHGLHEGLPVMFEGDAMHVTLIVTPRNDRGVQFPAAWQEAIEWRITDDRGASHPIAPGSIEVGASVQAGRSQSNHEPLVLAGGEIASVTYRLAAPPVGRYALAARLVLPSAALQSSELPFVVKRADESPGLQAIALRRTAERIRSAAPACDAEECRNERWNRYRDAMLRLAELEPSDAGIWEALGDVSLSNAAPEETRRYYARARDAADASLIRKHGSIAALPRRERELWTRRERELTLYAREVYPYAVAHPRALLIVEYQLEKQKRFIAFSRADGKQRMVFSDVAKPATDERR